MNEEVIKLLETKKDVSIRKVIDILLTFTDGVKLSETEKAQHAFDLLQRLNAICIAEVAVSFDNTAQICDEVAGKTKSLALTVFGEKRKVAKNTEANQPVENKPKSSSTPPHNSQQLSSFANNTRKPGFNRL